MAHSTKPLKTFFVEDRLSRTTSHHVGIKALWDLKWRKPASLGIYPFGDGKYEDFERIFSQLIKMDLQEPYDMDTYASQFFPVGEELVAKAEKAEKAGDTETAKEFYLRAGAVYRIARFPINYKTGKHAEAYVRGKDAYLKGSKYLSPPNQEILVPHIHGVGEEVGTSIPIYIRVPTTASDSSPIPVVMYISGLDGYRMDQNNWINEHVKRGYAVVATDIPGTGDSPAIRNDPLSPDRQWSSIFDWIATQKHLDSTKIIARGVSTGGHYAMRIAHTHKDRLLGVVSHGGGSHYMFEERWVKAQNHMEYPFDLGTALAYKFGYNTLEDYAREAQKKFSLLEAGLLDKPCAPLLLVNGMEDNIFPIEDSLLLLRHGDSKTARFADGIEHMGTPQVDPYIHRWIDEMMHKTN